MSKKNKAAKNCNEGGNMKNGQSDTKMENSKKTYQGNAQNCDNKNCK
jgi:hypothetical protein